MKNIFNSLIYSLNTIETHGKQNLDTLLGCIQTLEKLRDMVKVETREIKEGGEPNDDHNEQGHDA